MIWVKKTEDENGGHIDADGKSYFLEWCHKFYTKQRSSIQSFGYEQFESLEEAVEYWGLTEKPYEEMEFFESNEENPEETTQE